MPATQLWSHWQDLLRPCATAFTPRGFQLFTEWLTGRALNVEEHTITQSLVGLDRPQDWKALEAFAEYGSWDQDALEHASATLIDQAPERLGYGYRVWAGDDTKVHRSSKNVCKRTVQPVLVSVVTFGTRFSIPVSWRLCPCHKANPAIPTRNGTGDN